MSQATDEDLKQAHQVTMDLLDLIPSHYEKTKISFAGFCLYFMSRLAHRLLISGVEEKRIVEAVGIGLASAARDLDNKPSIH